MGNNNYSDEISSVVSGNSAVAGSLAPGGGSGGPSMWESPLDQATSSSVGCGGSYAKDQQAMSEKDPRALPSSSLYQVHPADQQLVGYVHSRVALIRERCVTTMRAMGSKSLGYDAPSIGEATRSASVTDASASALELLHEKDTVITELRETIQVASQFSPLSADRFVLTGRNTRSWRSDPRNQGAEARAACAAQGRQNPDAGGQTAVAEAPAVAQDPP